VGDSLDADYRGAEAVGMTPLLVDPDARNGDPHVSNRISNLFEVERWMDARGL
jgi:FMN phosphatase YigB (HAD superfamily)